MQSCGGVRHSARSPPRRHTFAEPLGLDQSPIQTNLTCIYEGLLWARPLQLEQKVVLKESEKKMARVQSRETKRIEKREMTLRKERSRSWSAPFV